MPPKKQKSGHKKEWTAPELSLMLSFAKRILPLDTNEWEVVGAEYNREIPAAYAARDA